MHVLPFYRPYDGADAGFDPQDHTEVDARLGSWADIAALGAGYRVMADVIVNHVSADSPQFRDWLADGAASPSAGMFLTYGAVFPGGATEDTLMRCHTEMNCTDVCPMGISPTESILALRRLAVRRLLR